MRNQKRIKRSSYVSFIKNNTILYLLLLLIVPFVLYLRVVKFEFSNLDDATIISNITNVQGNPFRIGQAFSRDAFMGNKGDTFYRPMQSVSFMLDAVVGGKEPWIYHLSNLILHVFTVIALFFFLLKVGVEERFAFILSLLFSINPILTNAIAWIPARGDILLCLFSLLSFITFLEYLSKKKTVYLILHTIAFLLAVFSKETAVIIPVFILSYLYFVKKEKFILKNINSFLAVWFVCLTTFLLFRQSVIKISHSSLIFGITPFFKNLPVIPTSFFKFFIPYNLSTMPVFDTTGIIGGGILLVVLVIMAFKFMRKEWRIVLWGIGWFLAFTIPPMFFRPYFAKFGYEYFEYRAYLPIIGILIIAGFLINKFSAGIPSRKMIIISIPIILVYSMIALIHLQDFSGPVAFFTSAIKTNPNNAMAFAEIASTYFYKGNKEKAMQEVDNSIKACPTYPIPYYNKGLMYGMSKDHSKAEYFLSIALKYDTVSQDINLLKGDTYDNLSLEKINLGKFNEAKILLKKALRIYPDNSKLYNDLGLDYYNTMKFDSSLYLYNKAIELDKNDYTFFNNRGMVKYHINDFSGALIDFNRVLELKPDYLDTWGSRGMTKIKLNDFEGAVYDLTRAISNKGDLGAALFYRGIAYSKLNRTKEAREDFEKAAESGNIKAIELLNNQKP
jgi:protein O-mannosyl-transferase